MATAVPPLVTRPLARDDWPAIERLFGANGACGGCWCMGWRVPMGGRTWDAAKGEPNRRAFRTLVESGEAGGVLAFAGDEPLGWCAIAPRAQFPPIDRSKALAREWHHGTWSLNCLFVPSRARGHGVGSALVAAAIDLARSSGPACRRCSSGTASARSASPVRAVVCTCCGSIRPAPAAGPRRPPGVASADVGDPATPRPRSTPAPARTTRSARTTRGV